MKKVLLLILDGFGINESEIGNAIKLAKLPNLDKIIETYPKSELSTSGEDVGLPKGMIGNSEVGHMTIGAGRTIMQPYSIINNSIKDKSFFENDTLLDLMDHVVENNSALHLIGLVSNSSNHSSLDHFYASLALAKIRKVKNVYFHFITDGRDTKVDGAKEFITEFLQKAEKLNLGEIGTICGRYYAMDNEGNYDRIKKYYDSLVYSAGNNFPNYIKCLDLHYKNNITDEYINPSIITKGCNIKDNDGILFVDFRPERMHELISVFNDSKFNMFERKELLNVKTTCLYSTVDYIDGAYTNESLSNTFGKYLVDLGFKQARIAETPKFPQVTYFFDGAEELSNKSIYKIMIEPPKVARFDMKPEMNIVEVTGAALQAMEQDIDFVLVNFCNPDVVAHTGNMNAVVRSLEACDICIGKLLDKAMDNYYDLIITSDHGNVEKMKNEDGSINVGHTASKVPFIVCDESLKLKESGSLRDVVPTIIDIYEISKPKDMTGESLLVK